MADGNWIEKLHKGGLHQSLGVKKGQKIPEKKVEAAANGADGPKAKKQAIAAEALKHLRPKA